MARIAGLFHLIANECPEKAKISMESMHLAAGMGRFLTEHSKAAYALMSADEKIEGAKRVLGWIRRIAKNTFSVRDCHQD